MVDAGEVKAHFSAVFGGMGCSREGGMVGDGCPGPSDFYSPGGVGVRGVIEGALVGDGMFKAFNVPIVKGNAGVAIAVRCSEEEVPNGVEGVNFEFEIVASGSGGVNKNFKVVIVVDDAVALGKGAIDVGGGEDGSEVEVVIVIGHLNLGAIGGGFAAEVAHGGKGFGFGPCRFIEVTIDNNFTIGSLAGSEWRSG